MKENNIINHYAPQIPDSVEVNLQIPSTVVTPQDTNSISSFGQQTQSLMSVESADTVAEIVAIPVQLQSRIYVAPVKESVDTLKYFTEYLNQITENQDIDNSFCLFTNYISYKPELSLKQNSFIQTKIKINTPKITQQIIAAKPKKVKEITNKTQQIIVVKPKEVKETIKKTQQITNSTISINKEHILQTNITDYKPNSWLVGVVILSLILFTWVRLFFNKNYTNLIKSGYNYSYSYKIFKDGNSVAQRVSILLNLIFVINISYFIYLLFGYLGVDVPINKVFLLPALFGIIVLIYAVKSFSIKIIGFIFKSEEIASEYISNIWIYNKILGLVLFPIVIALPYVNVVGKLPIIYIGMSLFVISLILRIVRSFQIVFNINLSIIYWILYLCTLEIIPIFVIGKILNLY